MKLWQVEIVLGPLPGERKGWVHYFVALAEDVDSAKAAVLAEHGWIAAGSPRLSWRAEAYEGKTISQTVRRCAVGKETKG